MIKLEVKDFTGVKLKVSKQRDGSLYISLIPVIQRANKVVASKLKELSKLNKEIKELHKITQKNQKAFGNQNIFPDVKAR